MALEEVAVPGRFLRVLRTLCECGSGRWEWAGVPGAVGSFACVRQPRPGDREFRSTPSQAFRLRELPHRTPNTGRCREVGGCSPPGSCAFSPLTWFGIFFPEESLGEGREMGRGSWQATRPSAALRAGSCALCGLISENSVVSPQDSTWRLLSGKFGLYIKRLAIPPLHPPLHPFPYR